MTNTTVETSTEAILAAVRRRLGFVPNLFTEMRASPAVLKVYLSGQEALNGGTLDASEQQAVQLAVSAANDCHYCQAAHEWLGRKVGLSPEDVTAIRMGGLPAAEGLTPVVRAARLLLEEKGWLAAGDLAALEREGITKAKLYEIVAFIGLKSISNYVNHIAHTPIDQEFAG
jgi:AhpD family alkylhydroperoxidase